MTEMWRESLNDDEQRFLGALWGKSAKQDGDRRPGEVNLLIQHLFDSLAVGELIWDHYLALGLRRRLDEVANGSGRSLLAWLCGVHDLGKATPAFQGQDDDLAERTEASGLTGAVAARGKGQDWRHERASALILRDHLRGEWSDPMSHVDWVWLLAAGHHGRLPPLGHVDIPPKKRRWRAQVHGSEGPWTVAQRALLRCVTMAAGYELITEVEPQMFPSRADQLLLSGLVVMADWIASDTSNFGGVPKLSEVSIGRARERAAKAWRTLDLHGGWGTTHEPDGDVVSTRFGQPGRPSQLAVLEAARSMQQPGLLIVEAPTGEGKTEAALAAAEILAARFGAHGIYLGLPTQATSDPMFHRVVGWLSGFQSGAQVALLHGKRRFNPEWQHLNQRRRAWTDSSDRPDGIGEGPDEFGMDEEVPSAPEFASICGEEPLGSDGVAAAAAWFQGPKRGLFAPNGVGTIDQVLYVGTCTRHVMLRYAGLAGKVVILDEIHAADVYMSQFLGEVLTWLGQGRVPVVLLSATLAPAQRRNLVQHYLRGALSSPDHETPWVDEVDGYPVVLSVWAQDGDAVHRAFDTEPWRPPAPVDVAVLEEAPDGEPEDPVVELLRQQLVDGGCALVVRNTVARARATFDALRDEFGADQTVLLHSRFSAADRMRTTERLLRDLGRDGPRPCRLIVVATQIAEQSFDVDADILVSDLAPIDLLVQRAGRLHRHRRTEPRPLLLRQPRLIVTGLDTRGELPLFPRGSEYIYSRHLLMRSAVLVREACDRGGWVLPTEVPALVARCYGGEADLLEGWEDDAAAARKAYENALADRAVKAEPFLLTSPQSMSKPTIVGLHRGAPGIEAEEAVRVRDGEDGVEVVLIRRDETGYLTLAGDRLGPNADHGLAMVNEVLGGTVRLPAGEGYERLQAEARRLGTLPVWRDHEWLKHAMVLTLDNSHRAVLGDFEIRYDPDRGLLVERGR